MQRTLCILLIWLSSSACTSPQAAPAPTGSAEQLLAQVPQNWFKGIDKQVGELKIEEYFPPGTEQYWPQKLVFESLTSEHLPDPIVYVNGLAEQQHKRCSEFDHYSVFSGFENGYPTVVQVLQCRAAKLTGKPVVTMIKAIKGNQSLYTISRIWRVDTPAATDSSDVLLGKENLAEFAAWSNTLAQIQACDNSLAAHRCASPP